MEETMIPLYFSGQLLIKQSIDWWALWKYVSAMDLEGLQIVQPVSIIVQMALSLSSEGINKSLNSSESQYFYL